MQMCYVRADCVHVHAYMYVLFMCPIPRVGIPLHTCYIGIGGATPGKLTSRVT